MAHQRKSQFWLDNAAGAITEYTSEINSAALQRAVNILTDNGLNDNDESVISGLRSGTLPLSGWVSDTTVNNILTVLNSAQGTSVSKTWYYKPAGYATYFYGEALPESLEISGDGQALLTWSTNLRIDDGVNTTSVAPA